jgi:hypothetical protein
MAKDESLKLEKVNIEKPSKPCWNCGEIEYHQTSYGVYLCSICHPKV